MAFIAVPVAAWAGGGMAGAVIGGIAAGIVTGAVIGAATAAITGGDILKGALMGAALGGISGGIGAYLSAGAAAGGAAAGGVGASAETAAMAAGAPAGFTGTATGAAFSGGPGLSATPGLLSSGLGEAGKAIGKQALGVIKDKVLEEKKGWSDDTVKILAGIGEGAAQGLGAMGAAKMKAGSDKELAEWTANQEKIKIAANAPGDFTMQTANIKIPDWWNKYLNPAPTTGILNQGVA